MGNCVATIMSQVMHISEKFSMWISVCSFVTCMILCMTCMLAFGIGLGYNYSFVDYKTKHVYVEGKYKKTRPTNYHGPGYYRPTTRATRSKTKAPKKLEVYEVIREAPVDLPRENPIEFIKDVEGALPLLLDKPRQESPLRDLYFTVKTLPTTRVRLIRKFDASFNASTPELSVNNETEIKVNTTEKSSIQRHHINTTEEYSSPEAISVDITKVTNVDNSSIAKTVMNLKQLLSFMTLMQEKKKKFSVQVTTL